jgi:threonine synthase
MKIVILEDDVDRCQAMRECLADRFQTYDALFFDQPAELIRYLDQHLAETILVSLDHDLELIAGTDGKLRDPGTGLEVAQYLAHRKPGFPVILHSTNSDAVVKMQRMLQAARWRTHRVIPFNDLEWIPGEWLRTVRRAILASAESKPGPAAAPGLIRGLKCRLCGKEYKQEALNFCTEDFGPLEVDYDYEAIGRQLTRQVIEKRPFNMWRYRELLPLDGEPAVGLHVGGTPLVRADRLAEALGVRTVWVKNDAVNFPTLSFKDRVVAVALSKAREFGFQTVGCASTGNLANSVAANAAAAGLHAYILVPADLERAKILGTSIYGAKLVGVHGTYDQVNRLCTQIAFKYGWGFVNINLRPFYAEGSKTVGYEIAEQLGWRLPAHVVCPMAGGSLIGKIDKAFKELAQLGLLDNASPRHPSPERRGGQAGEGGVRACRIHGAQASGCSPISTAVKNGWETHRPVKKPNTIAKSLAIGDPADGYFACKVIRESGGWADDVTDTEIAEAMALLARTEGIFAETAGGVTVAVTQKLIDQGRIPRDEEIVICITGNGLKTQDAIVDVVEEPAIINPTLAEFEPLVDEGTRHVERELQPI